MTNYPVWDVKATKELILSLYGKEQYIKAQQSLNSSLQRRDFARFHYFVIFDRWGTHLDDIKNEDPINIVLACADEVVSDRRAQRMDELAAHVHSCVHSLHTIPDTMAHAIYYGLGLNLSLPLKERKITAAAIARGLDSDGSLKRMGDLFRSIYASGEFTYLDALNNHGKHRSMVQPATWFDMTEKSTQPITLEFSEFSYDGVSYARREIKPVLSSEYERISKSIVDCGVELMSVLKNRAAAQGVS
jgi:hypothetical protein